MVTLKISQKKIGLYGSICGLSTAVGGIIGWIIMPYLVLKLIDLNVILYENSEQFQRWQSFPQPLEFKIFVFNVTNADEVHRGALPIVKEVGPYVYKQYRIKNVEEISKDGMNITYTSKQIYHFDRKSSYPYKENDKLVVLNVAMNVVVQLKKEEIKRIVGKLLKMIDNSTNQTPIVGNVRRLIEIISGNRKAVLQITEEIINSQLGFVNENIFRIFPNDSSIFMTTTPKAFFFDGIPFCIDLDEITLFLCKLVYDVVQHRNIKAIRKDNDGSLIFALFYYKNNTHDGQYKVLSGLHDSSKTTRILTWEGRSHLTIWANDSNSISSCNLFQNTTDGILFPPNIKPEGSLYVYSTDVCRTVELSYRKKISYRKIQGYRFEAADNFLSKIGSKYSTKCFCSSKLDRIPKYDDGCLYKGVMDLTLCHGAPLILSMPHILDAAPEYQTVKGLRPNRERAVTFVEVEPNTGYPLRGYKRAQFNMFVRKVEKIDFTNNFKTFLMPIVWVEEGTQLNDKMIRLLNNKLFTPLLIANISIYTAIGSGITIFLVCLHKLWRSYPRRKVVQGKIAEVRPVQQ